MAETLAWKLDEVERIDRMIAGAEARLNVALREIDRHRATLAGALRQAAAEVMDAEFKEIPPSLTEGEAGRESQCARQLRSEDGGRQRVSSRFQRADLR